MYKYGCDVILTDYTHDTDIYSGKEETSGKKLWMKNSKEISLIKSM
jgi:hypothetical protein